MHTLGKVIKAAITLAAANVGRTVFVNGDDSRPDVRQAIRCGTDTTKVYRYVGANTYRHYINETMASSWDYNWRNAPSIDCSKYTLGEPMRAHPREVAVGQTITCSESATELYRYLGNSIYRLYPDQSIGKSWDPNYAANPKVVECSVLIKDSPMGPNPIGIGQAIKCSSSAPEVYRIVANNAYRWYPNPDIAASWDSSWTDFSIIDCTSLTRKEAMKMNTLDTGKTIKCAGDPNEIYRYMGNGQYSRYRDKTFASSWDPNWASPVEADCSVMVKIDPLPLRDDINPDRGFLHHSQTYTLNPEPVTQSAINSMSDVSLVRRLYYLDAFNATDLNESFLNMLAIDLSRLGLAGKRVALRFAYRSDTEGPDPQEDIILLHLRQIRPTLLFFSAYIIAFEAGFVGKWGEWFYTSTYGDQGNASPEQMNSRATFVRSMAESVSAEVPIAVRSANWSNEVIKRNTTLASRVALYDDCINAPFNDAGTFRDNIENANNYPFGTGGEVCSDSLPINETYTCNTLNTALKRINATYLNLDFNKTRLEEYKQCNHLNFIGYVVEAKAAMSCSNQKCAITLSLVNTGYARPTRSKTLSIECGSQTYRLSLSLSTFASSSLGRLSSSQLHLMCHVTPSSSTSKTRACPIE